MRQIELIAGRLTTELNDEAMIRVAGGFGGRTISVRALRSIMSDDESWSGITAMANQLFTVETLDRVGAVKCDECGAVAVDKGAHDAWHRKGK